MAVIVDGADLHLTGWIGHDLFEDYFTHTDALFALLAMGDETDITIHLNSGGGHTDHGSAIANAIKDRAGKTTVIVEGVAMSAATFIACAADEVVMTEGSLWMIHEPMVSMSNANAADIIGASKVQAAMTDAYVRVYARKTGKPEKTIREWMAATTYFDPAQTVEAGFADRVSAEVFDFALVASAAPYEAYPNAPQKLVAMARANGWQKSNARTAEIPPKEEITVSDETKAAHAAATARIKAITLNAEAKGRDQLAAHLAFDTTIDATTAVSILKAAPADREAADPAAAYEASRAAGGLNGAGLGERPRENAAQTGIVAAMKQRHGAK